ncbi:ABC transporter ATP-binding protein [Phreatobacter oligotrophus]|uniref:Peptide/nickel transport system ATP-binding protein n=1 Tax=Phreatobacter oligotrophus TaxID=1122261 RepID=A0A2T4Z5R4_9HYPH|nr:ABC transporter ATP-binding protein [Phreatobacter oligotrophus]PTM57212.1 peptide/nickel transport system ATP-binding protein [Phreatobacter oligotrophus]
MTEPLLAVRGLTTEFPTRAGVVGAVREVSFDVNAGEIVGLVGESGSGKSVTGFSILGLIDPPGRIASGSVKLAGRELVGMAPRDLRAVRGREIAMVFQDPAATLNPVLRIGDQMALAIHAHERVSEAAARARVAEVLTLVGIPDAARRLDAYPHQFSGGMRQRVAIATALLNRPKLIICDEPTTALDVSVQAQILTEMRALARDTGTAMVWISHDLATVSALASRILVMYAGRVIEQGPIRSVLSEPRHPYTAGLLASLPARSEAGADLPQIPGAPPSMLALPKGCAFAPRCGFASPACEADPDPTLAADRLWRCHHPQGIAA